MSTTTPSKRELAFAALLVAHVDSQMDDYQQYADELQSQLDAAGDDDGRALLAIAAFLAALLSLADAITVEQSLWLAQNLPELSGPNALNTVGLLGHSANTALQRDVLVRDLQTLIASAQDEAKLIAEQTGLSLSDALAQSIGPGDLKRIRIAYDIAATASIHRELQAAGTGIFAQKIAVATLDSRTTALCRERMNGQVRGWDEMYVDPVSGSEWMHPPFIGAQLGSREDFHYCRTVSVPRR